MGRRYRRKQQDSILDDIFDLLKSTPIWVGPVLAVLGFALFRYLLPLLFPVKTGEADPGILIRVLLSTVSWFVGGAILFVWVLAEIHKLAHRGPPDRQSSFDSPAMLSRQAMQASQTTPSTSTQPSTQAAPSPQPSTQTATSPLCPLCGSPMTIRTARKGTNAGSQFWGCPTFPDCKGTRPL